MVADPIARTPLTDVAPRFDPAQEHSEAASTKLLVRTMLVAHQMVKVHWQMKRKLEMRNALSSTHC